MNKETSRLELVRKLVADKGSLQAPNVTCGSSKEREWWPPYVVQQNEVTLLPSR